MPRYPTIDNEVDERAADPPRSAPIRTGSGRSGGRIATAAAPPNCTGPDLRMFVKATRAAAAPKQTSMYEHVRSTPAGPGRSLERQLTVVVAPSLIHGCWHQTTAGGLQNPDQDRHYRMFSMARRPFNAINPTLERQLTVVVAPAGGSINCSCASWTKNPLVNTAFTPPANASGPRHIGSFRPVSTQIDRNPRPATPVPTCGGLGHVFDK